MKKHIYSNMAEYVSIQEMWNKKKLGVVWVTEEAISVALEEIKSYCPEVKKGICHGTRRGIEQDLFIRALGIEVIGTEISETANQFPNTIQWDFHNVKDEWVGEIDFIYSNSLDHSYNPELALRQWMSCLKVGGICLIDWSGIDHGENHVNDLDCFGASLLEMKDFLGNYGKVKIRKIGDRHLEHCLFIVEKQEMT